MAGGDGPFLCGACACFVVIPSIILIVLSFSSLQPVEYGLNFNAITMSLENTTYDAAGLYFLGFGHWFIRFPRIIQTIEFMANSENQLLHTRTSDGLPLTLGLSFQYRYIPEHLHTLYLTFRNDHHAVYVNTATATTPPRACLVEILTAPMPLIPSVAQSRCVGDGSQAYELSPAVGSLHAETTLDVGAAAPRLIN